MRPCYAGREGELKQAPTACPLCHVTSIVRATSLALQGELKQAPTEFHHTETGIQILA